MNDFSHLDNKGNVKMVDVTDKVVTVRIAKAEGKISMRTISNLISETDVFGFSVFITFSIISNADKSCATIGEENKSV